VADVLLAMQADSGLALPSLRVDGGPARNRFLMQTLADDLGVEVQVAAEVESTATGVAQIARHHAHGVPLDVIAGSWRAAEVYAPTIGFDEREERRARWRRAIALAMEMYNVGGSGD
jgi:glycerol kinase